MWNNNTLWQPPTWPLQQGYRYSRFKTCVCESSALCSEERGQSCVCEAVRTIYWAEHSNPLWSNSIRAYMGCYSRSQLHAWAEHSTICAIPYGQHGLLQCSSLPMAEHSTICVIRYTHLITSVRFLLASCTSVCLLHESSAPDDYPWLWNTQS